MSSTNEQLSKRDQFLIESYKEQNASWKHEDNLLYRFTTILLPVSIAALVVPYVQDKVPDLLATLGGLILITFWAFSCQIMETKSKLRFSITNKIEKSWRIPGHKDYEKIRKDTYDKRLKSYNLRCCMYWVYLSIVGMLAWFRFYGPGPTQQIFITKTVDFWTIVAVIVIVAVIIGWAMLKAKEDPPESGD